MELEFGNLSIQLTKELNSTTKKEFGIYFTPNTIIKQIVNFVFQYNPNIKSILEPSCGSCEFIIYIDNNYYNNVNLIYGIELHKHIFKEICNLKFYTKVYLSNDNFLSMDFEEKFDLIIGNPPYFVISKKDIDKKYSNNYLIEGRPNIYVIFILKAIELLNDNGIIAFVLPRNFLNCLYYNSIREFILVNFKILQITINESNSLGNKAERLGNNNSKFMDTDQEICTALLDLACPLPAASSQPLCASGHAGHGAIIPPSPKYL